MTWNSLDIDPVKAWQTYQPSPEMPWNNQRAAHLLRRAAFGGTIKQIIALKKMGPAKAIDQLFEQTNDGSIDSEMKTAGRLVTGGTDSSQLAAWWLLRMVKTDCPFLEKMTLFWHGHFATGADKVMDARAMLRQNQLLRTHAFGKFEPFVKKMSRDVAMLIYLDSEENRKTRPNENYARELMELFCLGPGNYSEHDIKEIARCFTGWEVRKKRFRFNEHQHDKKTKSFLGADGNYDGNEAIEVVLKQPSAARFIAKKLIRFFVVDDLEITDEFAEPIAQSIRESNFDMGEAVRMILSSNVFYSSIAMGQKIKSPVELAVGFLRFFDATTNVSVLSQRLSEIGQRPLFPPNVKGWEGGRTWINASTILARANLINEILSSDKTKFGSGSLNDWAKANSKHGVSESLDWLEEFMLAAELTEETHDAFVEVAKNGKSKPGKTLSWLAALPEFQLN